MAIKCPICPPLTSGTSTHPNHQMSTGVECGCHGNSPIEPLNTWLRVSAQYCGPVIDSTRLNSVGKTRIGTSQFSKWVVIKSTFEVGIWFHPLLHVTVPSIALLWVFRISSSDARNLLNSDWTMEPAPDRSMLSLSFRIIQAGQFTSGPKRHSSPSIFKMAKCLAWLFFVDWAN